MLKRCFYCAGLLLMGLMPCATKGANDGKVVSGNMRFTVLTPEMIRIEQRSSADADFVDDPTFTVVNRDLPAPKYDVTETPEMLTLTTDKLVLKYRVGSDPFHSSSPEDLTITLQLNGEPVVWHPGKVDDQNLKGTCRTLDGANGDNKRAELEDGLLSRSGWAIIDELETRGDGSKSLLFKPDAEAGMDWWEQRPETSLVDIYFMGYGHDYAKALSDFTKIAGKIPLPPLYAFGYWYSKYQKYTEDEFMQLVDEMEQNDIPLDVMVVDMGWHKEHAPDGGWTGWSWDEDYFPNPEAFLGKLHDKGLKVTLNLHPADGVEPYEKRYGDLKAALEAAGYDMGSENVADNGRIKWNIKDPTFYKAFFSTVMHPLQQEGVDFWWIDWQQNPFQIDGLSSTFWLNHVYFNDIAKMYPDRRAMIFHRWGGLGNHRYQLGFSGDSFSNFETLAFEPYFTATSSNVGYGYWGHDLGGHMQDGPNNPELFLRWIQYGVFSPIFRTHSTNAAHIERRIWKYPNFDLMKDAFELRYALVPYIYTQARKAYDTGMSICRPMYYSHPESDEAYQYEGQYMFGDDILVNPITRAADPTSGTVEQTTWLPAGKWYDVSRNTMVDGDKLYTDLYTHAEIPRFYKAGAIIPGYPKVNNLKSRPDNLILTFVPGADGELLYYEDEGDSENYKTGDYTFTRVTQKGNHYVIYPAEGKGYAGQPDKRSYTLRMLCATKPKAVKLDGRTTRDWTYDPASGTLTIAIPSTPLSATTTITLK